MYKDKANASLNVVETLVIPVVWSRGMLNLLVLYVLSNARTSGFSCHLEMHLVDVYVRLICAIHETTSLDRSNKRDRLLVSIYKLDPFPEASVSRFKIELTDKYVVNNLVGP